MCCGVKFRERELERTCHEGGDLGEAKRDRGWEKISQSKSSFPGRHK
jgi:hypothetical protein